MKINYLQKSLIAFIIIATGLFLYKNNENKQFYIDVVKDFSNGNYNKLDSLINPNYGVFTNAKFEDYTSGIFIIKKITDLAHPYNPKSKDTLFSNLEFGEIKYMGDGKFKKDDSFFSHFNGQYLHDPNDAFKGLTLTEKDKESEEKLKSVTKYKIVAVSRDQSKNFQFYFGLENHKIYLCAVTINPIISDEAVELETAYLNLGGESLEYSNKLKSYINKFNFFDNPKLLTDLSFLDLDYVDRGIIIGNTSHSHVEGIHDNFIQVKTKNNQIKTVYLTDSDKNFICADYGEVFKINGASKFLLIGNTYVGMGEATYSLQYFDLEKPDFGLNENVFGESSSHYIITVNYDITGKENRINDFSIRQLSAGQYMININEKKLMLKWNGTKFIGDLITIKKDTSTKYIENNSLTANTDTQQTAKPNIDNHGIVNSNLSVENYIKMGNEKFNGQDYVGAIEEFNKAIAINPNDIEIYQAKASVKNKLKDYQGAIKDYDKAISINPNGDLYKHRGNEKFSIHDYPGAISDYDEAIEITPKGIGSFYIAECYYSRGETKFYLQDYQGAITDFTRVIELNQKQADAYFMRGLAKRGFDDREGACSDWNKAGELGNTKAIDAIKKFCN